MASTEVFTRIAEKMDLTFVLKMDHGLADHHVDDSTLILEQLEVEAHDWYHLLVAILDEKVTAYASLMPIGQLQFGVRGMDMHRLSCPNSCLANAKQWARIQTTLQPQKFIWRQVLNGCPMHHVFGLALMDKVRVA
ncbi:MAG: hypothetical protein QMB38_00900 [Ascidiaceihabitans sp.]|jgi:hypothetical protein